MDYRLNEMLAQGAKHSTLDKGEWKQLTDILLDEIKEYPNATPGDIVLSFITLARYPQFSGGHYYPGGFSDEDVEGVVDIYIGFIASCCVAIYGGGRNVN